MITPAPYPTSTENIMQGEEDARDFIQSCQRAGTCFVVHTASETASVSSTNDARSVTRSSSSISSSMDARLSAKQLFRFFPTAAFNDNNYVMEQLSKMMCVTHLTVFVQQWIEKTVENFEAWESFQKPIKVNR
jgi:hypothetical protein